MLDEPAKTILVVEDNDITREGLAAVLRRAACRVATAENGQQALGVLGADPPPDLILLDMLMPVLDGWHFLDRLKRSPRKSVPVVVTTGTILTPEWATQHGCAGFIKK